MNDSKAATVLCVDDDPLILHWLEIVLPEHGYEVRTETDPEKAQSLAREVKPDLILLDARMKPMDGFQLCARFQEDPETVFTPVIFLTGFDGMRNKARAFAAGAADYLVKPIEEDLLVAKVEAHLKTGLRWRELVGMLDESEAGESGGSPCWIPDRLLQGVSEFETFKDRLAAAPDLTSEARAALRRVAPSGLYEWAAAAGISAERVAAAAADFLGVPYAGAIRPEDVELAVLPASFCRAHQVLPVTHQGTGHALLLANPFRPMLLPALRRAVAADSATEIAVTLPGSFEFLVRNSEAAA